MNAKVILAPNGEGISRAEKDPQGGWQVDFLLQDIDVRCLAANPHDPRHVYAGTQGAGVLHSGDGGETWRPMGLDGDIVKSLAVSPHDPQTIFAGTKPAYLFHSRDGGRTWQELEGFRRVPGRWWWISPAEKPFQAYVQSIAFSPTDPDVVLAGIEFGAVLASQDGGQTWSGHRKGALRDCHNLMFHSADGNWVYEAGGGGASYSRDGGRAWQKLKNGLAHSYGVACAADAAKPEVWYVSIAPGPWKAYGDDVKAYLYRASGGSRWQPIGWEDPPMKAMPISLVTDPKAPGHLYAGTTKGDVWHTFDYGASWQKLPLNLRGIWRSMIVL